MDSDVAYSSVEVMRVNCGEEKEEKRLGTGHKSQEHGVMGGSVYFTTIINFTIFLLK